MTLKILSFPHSSFSRYSLKIPFVLNCVLFEAFRDLQSEDRLDPLIPGYPELPQIFKIALEQLITHADL